VVYTYRRRGLELRREVDLWCALRRYSDHTVRGTALPVSIQLPYGLLIDRKNLELLARTGFVDIEHALIKCRSRAGCEPTILFEKFLKTRLASSRVHGAETGACAWQ
jgi:hypothetical protein